MSEAVHITGAAIATSLGLDRETVWRNILAGKCGMGPLTAMESPLPPDRDGGQAVELPADYSPKLPREARYLKWTIAAALRDAGLLSSVREESGEQDRRVNEEGPYAASRIAVMLGTTLHGIRAGGAFFRTGDYQRLRDFPAGATVRMALADLPITGSAMTTCSACSSSLGSIALATTLLATGAADCVIAGGYDTISEYVYGGFNSLRLVSPGPLRPFCKNRQGMKLAEGYGIVVLERASDAAARNKPALARVQGWGESADSHHLTQPHPKGDGAVAAMTAALRTANLSPQQIDLVAAHATGTPDNDAGEYAALSRVFGDDLPRVPVVGFKSHLGHTLGGAGAVELILSILVLRDQIIPACANVKQEDLEFPGLNVAIDRPRRGTIRATLNTSLGFGGANTCMVLTRPDELSAPAIHTKKNPLPNPPPEYRERGREVFITGIGAIAPGLVGCDAWHARLAEPRPMAELMQPIPDAVVESLLNARRIRRMSAYVKLQLAAVTLAARDAGIADSPELLAQFSAILGSAHGSATYSCDYYSQIVKEGIPAANPMLFAEGVPNSAAAHVSLMLGLKGACQAIIGTRNSGLDALTLATARIASGQWDRAIVGGGEEDCLVVRQAYEHCGMAATVEASRAFASESGFACGTGAAALVLESRAAMDARGGRAIGRVDGAGAVRGERQRLAASLTRLLRDTLHAPANVISSAAGTWLDGMEAAACRAGGAQRLSAIYGHVAETFSATPLLGLTAALATKSLPRLLGDAGAIAPVAAGADEPIDHVAIVSSDPNGVATAVRVAIL